MTVAELIERLQAFPADMPIQVDWPEQMYGGSQLGDINEIVEGDAKLWDATRAEFYVTKAVIFR